MAEEKNTQEEEKSEFDKLLEKLEKEPVPERQCDIDDDECLSCGA
jgi:ferredoxin